MLVKSNYDRDVSIFYFLNFILEHINAVVLSLFMIPTI